jgi:hypothetical protein
MNIPNVNYTVHYVVHAYRQAPWRIQRQWIGMFLLIVLGLAMVASLYLDVTAQAALSGRAIQDLSAEISAGQQANADLETQLSELTSTYVMEKRAAALGYQPIAANQAQYVIVPGYSAPQPAILANSSTLKPSAPSILPEYTESLIDWFGRHLAPSPVTSMIGISQ